jgi:hypothetical protein
MVDWTSGLADASVAERDSGFVIVRIPGTPDVLKEAAVSGFVTKDANGNVAIGATSAVGKFTLENAANTVEMTLRSAGGVGANSRARIIAGYEGGGSDYGGYLAFNTTSSSNVNAERMRITGEGQFRWGNTATIDTVSFLPFQVRGGIAIDTGGTDGESAMSFFNGQGPNTRVGWIGTLGSSTSYNTSSDRTLKKNIADAQDPESIILSILIRQFDWKVNDEHQRYGAIAQELLDVYPEAVSSGPDGILGVDFSKFIPMMLKHIQLLTARVALLEGAKS